MASKREMSGRGKLRRELMRNVQVTLDAARSSARPVEYLAPSSFSVGKMAGRLHRLVDPIHFARLANSGTIGGSDRRSEVTKISDQLCQLGPWRPLAAVPAGLNFDDLRERFPNFVHVIEFVEGQIALARTTPQEVVTLPNTLLLGDPGVGKSTFAKALAALLGTPYAEIPMNSLTAGFSISGLDSSWSGAKPGKVFELLTFEVASNPIILIDEIDKAGGDARYDTGSALLSLLESSTSRAHVDEYAEIPIDASKVIWIATANSEESMPKPLISRFAVFHILAPSAAHAARICQSVYSSLRSDNDWGPAFPEKLSDGVIQELAGDSPREVKRALQAAAGQAALAGRAHILCKDLHVFKSAGLRSTPTIGFVQHRP